MHRWADIRIKDYVEFPRSNYSVTTSGREINATLRRDHDRFLYANNATSRIRFARIVVDHVSRHQAMHLGPLFFVTFALADDAFPITSRRVFSRELHAGLRSESAAAEFSCHRLQQRVRQALHGLPFFGMVEVALFKRWGPQGESRLDWASWHLHVYIWGVPKCEIERAVAPMRQKYRSVLDWLGPVHIREVNIANLQNEVVYPFKAPQKATEVKRLKAWVNPRTGEVRPAGWHAQKDWMRTADRVRLLDIMGDRTLDKLIFGGGAGMDLVRAIREEALRPWEQHKRIYRH